jgi:hypothetical protein
MNNTIFYKNENKNVHYNDKEINDGFYKGKGWYFWDETETNLIGPFKTENRALIALKVYFVKI